MNAIVSVTGRAEVDDIEMANALRFLAIDAVEKAKSGHPGMSMGMADVATVTDRGGAGRGDRTRHQARSPQGQHRYRLPPGDDRCVPQGGNAGKKANSTRGNSSSLRWMRCATFAASEQFGTAGNASRIKVIPLSEMARRYRSGALDPQIGEIVAAA
jgi:Transketolase, thiamine diphosphate binding domain